MLFDMDASNLPVFGVAIVYDQRTYTQEFNLISKEGARLFWVAVLVLLQRRRRRPFDLAYFGAPMTPGYLAEQESDAYAVFADVTYEIVDRLFLTGGVRYSSEERTAHYETYSPVVGPRGEGTNSETFSSTTPCAVFAWELGDRSSVYASWSRDSSRARSTPRSRTSVMPFRPRRSTRTKSDTSRRSVTAFASVHRLSTMTTAICRWRVT